MTLNIVASSAEANASNSDANKHEKGRPIHVSGSHEIWMAQIDDGAITLTHVFLGPDKTRLGTHYFVFSVRNGSFGRLFFVLRTKKSRFF